VRRFPLGLLLAIAIGGAAGTLLRAAVAYWMPPSSPGFPWDTFLVNVAGCVIVGFVAITALERAAPSTYLRPLLGTGFCGGLTTFSTWVVEADLLFKDGDIGTGLVYLASSLVAGLAAARIGMVAAKLAWNREE
jgi:CrcB protein